MNILEQEAILRAWKEETGKDYFIQCEDGTVLASTWSPKERFFREIIDGKLAEGEIREEAGRLKLDFSAGRILLLLESEGLSTELMREVAEAMFPDALEQECCMSESGMGALLFRQEELPDLREAAEILRSALEVETVSRVRIGVSRCFFDVCGLPAAGEEAQLALLSLKRFPGTACTALYEELGLKRVVLQMPEEQSRAFLAGFSGTLEQLLADEELARTADVFLETGLNSAETARQLIIHRNTLNYRLEKIQKLSGLDLKSFSDATAFRMASLVWQNLRKT